MRIAHGCVHVTVAVQFLVPLWYGNVHHPLETLDWLTRHCSRLLKRVAAERQTVRQTESLWK